MPSGSGKLLQYVVSSFIVASGIVSYILGGGTPRLAISIAAAILFILIDDVAKIVAGFAWCVYLSVVSPNFWALTSLVAAILPHVYIREVKVGSRSSLITTKLTILPLLFGPLYMVGPTSLLVAVTYTASLLLAVFTAYLKLSRSRVLIERRNFSAYLGDPVLVPVVVEIPEEVLFKTFVDDAEVMGGVLAGGRSQLFVKLVPEVAGVRRYSLQVVLVDKWMLSKVSYGPYEVVIRVVPRSSVIIRKAREILSAYVSSSVPEVYVGRISWVAEPAVRGYPAQHRAEELVESLKATARFRLRWELVTRVVEALASTSARAFRGEYVGVREYVSGDSPRSIHWKKSVSLGELIVKVYESEGSSHGGGPIIVVASWDASSPVELDSLIQATYSALVAGGGEKFLYLHMPSDKIYYIAGNVLDVLKALDMVLSIEGVEARFRYESYRRERVLEVIKEISGVGGKLALVDSYYRASAKALVEDIESRGITRRSRYVLIHPKAYTLKYTYLAMELERRGYNSAVYRLLKPEEIVSTLRRAAEVT